MACLYPSCTTRRRNGNSKHLKIFSFPSGDKQRALQWAVNCNRPDLVDFISHGGIVPCWNGICTLHFERPCFNNDLENSITRLAIPTIFQTKDETDIARLSYKSTFARKSSSVSETIPEKAEQLNSQNELHDTLVKTIANNCSEKYTSCTTPTNLTQSDHAADVEPSEQMQTLFEPKGESMFSTVSLIARPAIIGVGTDHYNELICRLCAKQVCISQMVHIFGQSSSAKEYLRKINQFLPVSEQPAKNDRLPKWVCNVCCERLNYCDQAIHDFVSASVTLKRLVSHTRAGINNSELPTRQAGDAVTKINISSVKLLPQEQFDKEFSHILLHSDSDEEVPLPNCANIQQIESTCTGVPRPTSREDRKLSPAMSVCKDNIDSLQFTGSQCANSFLDKNRLFHHKVTTVNTSNAFAHTSKIENEKHILLKPVINYSSVPLESQHFAPSHIMSPINRKQQQQNNEIMSILASGKPKFVTIESVNCVDNLIISKGLMMNKKHLHNFPKSSQPKKRRKVCLEEECHGKIIQSSHTIIPTSSDNKTFLCEECDMSFDSIESALTHRFKEHAKQETFCTKPT